MSPNNDGAKIWESQNSQTGAHLGVGGHEAERLFKDDVKRSDEFLKKLSQCLNHITKTTSVLKLVSKSNQGWSMQTIRGRRRVLQAGEKCPLQIELASHLQMRPHL